MEAGLTIKRIDVLKYSFGSKDTHCEHKCLEKLYMSSHSNVVV